MICARHGHIAAYSENGQVYCFRCFTEAREKAEDILLEAKLAATPGYSVDALIRRLGGRA